VTNPVRSLGLLWGPQGKTGRSGLSIRGIVTTAIEVADAQGIEAVSMRKIAEALNVGTMSLYTHIPGKAELTDLMIDTVYGELYSDIDEPLRQPGGWRAGLEFVANRNWELYQRHPWLLLTVGVRPAMGPNAFNKYEAELRPLEGIGLSDVDMDSALSLVLSHVDGRARFRHSLNLAREEQSDNEWWLEQLPLLERVASATPLPVANRVGQASSEFYQGVADPAHALAFGLARILDGIDQLIKSTTASG
jgi:AcrR family transcriptional regulator